jgi:hypothetical protein
MIKKYLQKIYDEAYQAGYNSGLVEGVRTERGMILRELNVNTDMLAFQDTAKNKTTKVAADGMQIGYEYAVEIVRKRAN